MFHRWPQAVNVLQRYGATTSGEHSEQSSETGRRFLRTDDADTTCHLFCDSVHTGQHYYDVGGKLHRGNLCDQACRGAYRGVSGQNLLRTWCSSVVFERGVRAWCSNAKREIFIHIPQMSLYHSLVSLHTLKNYEYPSFYSLLSSNFTIIECYEILYSYPSNITISLTRVTAHSRITNILRITHYYHRMLRNTQLALRTQVRRNILLKFTLHLVCLAMYSVWWDYELKTLTTSQQILTGLCLLYLFMSSLQICYGYPAISPFGIISGPNFFADYYNKKFEIYGWVYRIFYYMPLLPEVAGILDWACTST